MIAFRLNELFALKLAGVRHAHRPPRVRSRTTCSAPAKVSRRGWSARWRISPPRAPSASAGLKAFAEAGITGRTRLVNRVVITSDRRVAAWGALRANWIYLKVRTSLGLAVPDVQYFFTHASYADPAVRELDRAPGMTLSVYQCRPESKGSIHAKSPDPTAAPAIRPNYLADELDRRTLVAGLKIARRIVSNPALDRYRAFEMNPGDQCQSDDDFLDYARRSGQTAFHVIGTCKMGNDPMAVVDDELRVRELEGLRVVDASIMPTMVSGNTNASVIMIAEKGADMIKAAAPQRARAA
jgi:hypothetical protein